MALYQLKRRKQRLSHDRVECEYRIRVVFKAVIMEQREDVDRVLVRLFQQFCQVAPRIKHYIDVKRGA